MKGVLTAAWGWWGECGVDLSGEGGGGVEGRERGRGKERIGGRIESGGDVEDGALELLFVVEGELSECARRAALHTVEIG